MKFLQKCKFLKNFIYPPTIRRLRESQKIENSIFDLDHFRDLSKAIFCLKFSFLKIFRKSNFENPISKTPTEYHEIENFAKNDKNVLGGRSSEKI